jgi:hypothetical protein
MPRLNVININFNIVGYFSNGSSREKYLYYKIDCSDLLKLNFNTHTYWFGKHGCSDRLNLSLLYLHNITLFILFCIMYFCRFHNLLASLLDGSAVSFGVRSWKLSNVRKRSVGWVTKIIISRAPPCYGRHFSRWSRLHWQTLPGTNQHCARVVGYSSISLCEINKEDLCLSSGDINRLIRDTYTPLTLFPWRSNRGISDISPRRPRFTKMT